ncbi:MAG: 3-isopropylmalate dehydratase small subunit [Acidimicrobiales bacterium]
MLAVSVLEGRAVPLRRAEVDTDQIIPSEWLKRVERSGFGRGLFSEWRDDPAFVLNQPSYQGATILVVGPHFGIGSSREHAVWALLDYGFRAVIASSFGDIFRTNAGKQGLVVVALGDADVNQLADWITEEPDLTVVVDVERGRVEVPARGWRRSFPMDDWTRQRLINGWDDVGLALRHGDAIDAFEGTSTTPSLGGLFDGSGHLV